MEALSETDSPEIYILNLFQIHKVTGFTCDIKTSFLSPLCGYFRENDPIFARMFLGDKSLDGICEAFSSYRDYISRLAQQDEKKHYLNARGINTETIIKTILDIPGLRSVDEFETDMNTIKIKVLSKKTDRKEILSLLQSFILKYFPQAKDTAKPGELEVQIQYYRESTLSAIRSILQN